MPIPMLAALVSDGDSHTITLVGQISDADLEELKAAIADCELHTRRTTHDYVRYNFLGYMAVLDAAAALSPEQSLQEYREVSFDLAFQAVNWLLSVRLFLDHTETELKRRYGNDSDAAARFKRACAKEFDSSFAYRLAYKLRNYAQHCGVGGFAGHYSGSRQGESMKVRLRTYLDLERILETDSRVFGSFAAEMRAADSPIDMVDFMREVMECLGRVMTTVLAIDGPSLDRSGATIARFRRIVKQEGLPGHPLVIVMNDDRTPTRLQSQLLPIPSISAEGEYIPAQVPFLAAGTISIIAPWETSRET